LSTVLFFVAALGALTGAIGVITIENPFYTVLALVSHLISLAALFLLLSAEFIAAAQVVVYAGAVMVLYTFVVSYVGGQDAQPRLGEPLGRPPGRAMTVAAWACGGALVLELGIAVLGSALKSINTRGAPIPPGFGQPAQIGDLLLTHFLAPFEIASYLLLVAAVGAVVLARRRGGIGDDDGIPVFSAMDIFRPPPPGTGTMAEGAGRREITREEPAAEGAGRGEITGEEPMAVGAGGRETTRGEPVAEGAGGGKITGEEPVA
jgi:NADH:ubiquinone oxidoreductase subunit 6 (subunit J)